MPEALAEPTPIEPPDLTLSQAEWARLGNRQRPASMDERWSVRIDGDRLALLRGGRHAIFDADFTEAGDARSLAGLRVEGDVSVFNRGGFSNDTEVADLFVTVIRRLSQDA